MTLVHPVVPLRLRSEVFYPERQAVHGFVTTPFRDDDTPIHVLLLDFDPILSAALYSVNPPKHSPYSVVIERQASCRIVAVRFAPTAVGLTVGLDSIH